MTLYFLICQLSSMWQTISLFLRIIEKCSSSSPLCDVRLRIRILWIPQRRRHRRLSRYNKHQSNIKNTRGRMNGRMKEENSRAPVNSQWLIAHTYKRSSSYRYIFIRGVSTWERNRSSLVRVTPKELVSTFVSLFPNVSLLSSGILRCLFLVLFPCATTTPRSRVLRVSNEKGL